MSLKLQPTITNDGKGNFQSFKAQVDYEFMTSNGSFLRVTIIGYGRDEFEARRNFVSERVVIERDSETVFGLI
jgi:hypothetical protein